ncbi:MAG: hypothetical protein ACK4UP_04275 [Spirosomataceae bacterium]
MNNLLINLNSYLLVLTRQKKIYLTCALFLFFLLAFPPNILQKRISGEWEPIEQVVQDFLNAKIESPWKPALEFREDSHFAKRDLRITPYLIGSFFHIESIKLFYLQIALFPFFIYLLFNLLYRFSKEGISTFYGVVALLFSYVGNSFFFDTLFLDSLGYFGLLASFFFLRNPVLIPLLLITFFVDERTIAPALVLPLSAYFSNAKPQQEEIRLVTYIQKTVWSNRTFWLIVSAVFIYLITRFWLFQKFGLTTPVGFKNGVSPIVASKFGLKVIVAYFSGLKASNLWLIMAVFVAYKLKNRLSILWLMLTFLLFSFIGLSVEDITRSIAYGFPVALVSFQYLFWNKQKSGEEWGNEFQLIALVSVVFPTYTLILNLIRIEAFAWLL